MELIKWSEEISVNIVEIDNQHKKLVGMINRLYAAIEENKGNEAFGNILHGLITYAAIHFATEEKYFDMFGYPDAKFHKEEHRYFKEKINDFKETFDKEENDISIDILNFLENWLKKHILECDKKFGPFFIEKGLC